MEPARRLSGHGKFKFSVKTTAGEKKELSEGESRGRRDWKESYNQSEAVKKIGKTSQNQTELVRTCLKLLEPDRQNLAKLVGTGWN